MPAREQHREEIDDRAPAHIEPLDKHIGDERGGRDHCQGNGAPAQFASNRVHSNQGSSAPAPTMARRIRVPTSYVRHADWSSLSHLDRGNGFRAPETKGPKSPLRGLHSRQRPHARYLNRGNARKLGAIHQRPGNAGSHWTAWWAREDSNLQPDHYGRRAYHYFGRFIHAAFSRRSTFCRAG